MYYSVFWQYNQGGTWFNSCDHCTNYARGLERFEQMQELAETMPHAYRKVTCTFEDDI
jgi:hypothetical protein